MSDTQLRDAIPQLSTEQRAELAHLATLTAEQTGQSIEECERVLLALTQEDDR